MKETIEKVLLAILFTILFVGGFFVYYKELPSINTKVSQNADNIAENTSDLSVAQEQQQAIAKGLLRLDNQIQDVNKGVFGALGRVIGLQQKTIGKLNTNSDELRKIAKLDEKFNEQNYVKQEDLEKVKLELSNEMTLKLENILKEGGENAKLIAKEIGDIDFSGRDYSNEIQSIITAINNLTTAYKGTQEPVITQSFEVVAQDLVGSVSVAKVLTYQKTGCANTLLPQDVKDYVNAKDTGNFIYAYTCDDTIYRHYHTAKTNPWQAVSTGNPNGWYVSQSPYTLKEVLTEK